MKEIWKDISGYEGKYQVSNFGNVKSLNYRMTSKEHPLTPGVDTSGYLFVALYENGKSKNYRVHRLVAEAFITDKTNFKYVNEEDRNKYINNLDKLQINHKDEERKNDCVYNLEWCTNWYNQLYGIHNERVAISQRNDPNKSKRLYQLNLDNTFIKEWPSVNEVKRQTSYNAGCISACCRGERKTAYGYKWCYVD